MHISQFWRNVILTLSGSTVSQVIPIVGTLLLARIFSPAEFGFFSVWFGFVIFFGVCFTGRYETSFAIEADGEPRLLAVISTILLVVVIVCMLFLFLSIASLFDMRVLDTLSNRMVYLAVLSGMFLAISQVWQSWVAADGNYAVLNWFRLIPAALITVFQIIAGLLHPQAESLMLAYAAGLCFTIMAYQKKMPVHLQKIQGLAKDIFIFYKKNKAYPIWSLPADMVSSATAMMPVLLISKNFGAEQAGLFAMSLRILGVPLGLLGKSVLDVFKRIAAEGFKNKGNCKTEFVSTFKILLLGSVIFVSISAVIMDEAFAILFGSEWSGAAKLSLVLLPLFGFRFIASPLSYLVYIAGRQKLDLYWQLALTLMTWFCFSQIHNFDTALSAYSALGSFLYCFYIYMSFRFSLGRK
jgi:O-antigen/teichoic acid export membrane protein